MKTEKKVQTMAWNKCPGCGVTVAGNSDYCPDCGEPWTIKCSSCGLTQRFWKLRKFCTSCGTRMEWHGLAKSQRE